MVEDVTFVFCRRGRYHQFDPSLRAVGSSLDVRVFPNLAAELQAPSETEVHCCCADQRRE